jgi:hypothetical protein
VRPRRLEPGEIAAADSRTTTMYDRRRQNLDRHAAYILVAFVAGR